MKRIFQWGRHLWMLLPIFASAQNHSQTKSHSPKAVVPPPTYQSAFASLPAFDPERPHADQKNWRKANEDVAKFPRGHIDILKWEAAQTAQPKGEQSKGGQSK